MLIDGTEASVTGVASARLTSIESRFDISWPESGLRVDRNSPTAELTCLEICAGGGGQSLGLEQAGFSHVAAVEIDLAACETLRLNRPEWNIVERDIHHFEGAEFKGIDLLAGGVPCPPFSIAGKQLGADDERDLFPRALHLVEQCEPTAIMLENVRGLSTAGSLVTASKFSRGCMNSITRLLGKCSTHAILACRNCVHVSSLSP